MRILLVLAVLLVSVVRAQDGIHFLGRLDYQGARGTDISGLWGYTDELGNEYALVGVNGRPDLSVPGGISVVALGDGTTPEEVFFLPGPPSIWREVKVWGDHAYITTEAEDGGLTILDLSPLPQSTDLPSTVWMAPDWSTAHSLFIDEGNGRLYIHGADRDKGGVIIYDLAQDPWQPVEVGSFQQWYCHDGHARGDIFYGAHIYQGFFSVIDVSDPAAPVLLGTQETFNRFTHNVWPDDSGNILFTTDERSNAYIGVYDVADPADITFLGKWRSGGGSGAVPHNTHWRDGYLVTSYYTHGVTVHDALRPHNLVEVGHYDTSPFEGAGFRGAWGVFPFFASGRIIVSDIQEGLFVLGPEYERACWLEGTVRDAVTQIPVGNARVSILDRGAEDVTGIDGRYTTGHRQPGTCTVRVSAYGYAPAVIEGVSLNKGDVTLLDVGLVPLVPFVLEGMVSDALSTQPVPGAHVRLVGEYEDLDAATGEDGAFSVQGFLEGVYDVSAAAWGWRESGEQGRFIAENEGPLAITLERGYQDGFSLDQGWTSSFQPPMGPWERMVPVPGGPGSLWPEEDAGGGGNGRAYVAAWDASAVQDTDEGEALLVSPGLVLDETHDPFVRYYRWFHHGAGGNGGGRMRIALDDGTTSVVLEDIVQPAPQWTVREYRIADHVDPSAVLRLTVSVTADGPGVPVVAAFDRFEVFPGSSVGVEASPMAAHFGLWPNPTEGDVVVSLQEGTVGTILVSDATGREVAGPWKAVAGANRFRMDVPAGTYFVRLVAPSGEVGVRRLVLVR